MTKRPKSLIWRLILTLTIGASLVWLAAATVALISLRGELDETFDTALQESAHRLLPLALDGLADRDNDHDAHEVPHLSTGEEETQSYQILDAAGSVLLRSYDAPDAAFDTALLPGFADRGDHRIYTEADRSGTIFIQVAEPLEHRREALLGSLTTLLLPLAAVIPLAALGIWLAVSRGLAPVKAFQREIGRRDASNLAPLESSDLPAELVPISIAVQRLIDRLRAALDAERSFASNSAHELRTPIAGSLAQTQRLIAELEGTPAQARAVSIETSLKRLRDLAEKLLQLSRADARMAQVDAAIDLSGVTRLVCEDCARRLPDPQRVQLQIAPGAPVRARIDIDAYGIALRNLIENAILHGAEDQPVLVSVPGDGTIRVRNGGPALGAQTLATLKQRFVRGPTSGSGSGLGLAIVDTIASQTGGRLELKSPASGQDDGFEAILILPAQ